MRFSISGRVATSFNWDAINLSARWMAAWINESMNEWMSQSLTRWMNEWMNEWMSRIAVCLSSGSTGRCANVSTALQHVWIDSIQTVGSLLKRLDGSPSAHGFQLLTESIFWRLIDVVESLGRLSDYLTRPSPPFIAISGFASHLITWQTLLFNCVVDVVTKTQPLSFNYAATLITNWTGCVDR